ncbi:MAG: type I DNA topoisomerase [Acidimicrobiia bacterium]|nr:type I DNA topoisomerase [Acidimicrobiia bacterium]
MPKPLVIVESPAKARTIAGFLGDDFVVESSVGHIRDLPRSAEDVPAELKGTPAGRLGIDIEDHFRPVYLVTPDKKKVATQLRRALKDASELYLATDEDREGEAIAWHVLEVLKPTVPVKRMVFHEITPTAIREAVGSWRDLDMKLVEAQEGRRILDRLVGYELSPVLWKKVMPRLSAGRVQSVATRLVVDRERARMAFRTGSYWDLEGDFSARGVGFRATLVALGGRRLATGRDFDPATGRVAGDLAGEVVCLDEEEARGLADRLDGADFSVASVESSAWKQSPHPPFITSTLQQEAGRKLRFSSARTMAVAQRLYERGYITYMRTDSTHLSEQAITAARRQIGQLYGEEYLPQAPRQYRRKVKNAQEAHEAIRPAGEAIRTPDQVAGELDADERRLYELVWKRTIACQMTDARGRRVSLRLGATSSAGEQATFGASGRTIEFPGYLRAYVEGADDPDAELEDRETPMPPVTEGEAIACEELAATGHTTQPPARYSEASLVKELEARGIGRPSTYAAVIQTIQDRGYVWKKGSALVPSWTAFAVIQLLEEHFGHLVDYGFTARMEEDLDQIARNEGESEKWLESFYFGNGQVGLRDLVAEERIASIDARAVNTIPLGVDAEGRPIAVRVGRYGPYLEQGEERASLPEDLAPDELTIGKAVELLERGRGGGRVLGVDPATGLPVTVRDGRYGPYVQLGEPAEGSGEKPRTASLFKSMQVESVTLEEALALLSLPRVVGVDAEGRSITAQNGRYGPYLKRDTETRSLDTEEQLFTVTMEEAEALLAQPKQRGRRTRAPLAELGPHPDSGAPVRILDGRFGPYVTDGTTNASLPRGVTPEDVTMEEALSLLAARAGKGPARRRKGTGRTAARRAPVKKPAAKKAAAKKATTKKAAAKKAAPKEAATTEPTGEKAAAGTAGPGPARPETGTSGD